ncbi:MAG TPA: helix-turn-helix transcriptional regulator [Thermoanaerobaculia bacterium]|nr:helix-turn-helix transcriptional regulator [Thermoanaerobaculia bacterium]
MDQETLRLINVLKVSLKILGVTNREVARRMGMSPSYLSKLFSGGSEMRLDHVIRICRAIGIEPAEFFTFAYPVPPMSATPSAARLREMLQIAPPAPQPPPAELFDEKKIQQMLNETLERLASRSGGS